MLKASAQNFYAKIDRNGDDKVVLLSYHLTRKCCTLKNGIRYTGTMMNVAMRYEKQPLSVKEK